ncbi:aminoglycoside phosphotransferase family protein [Arthrobacter sp. zg-Y411]|uniref:aminoglycoside phosphotransferase family protein n=1 Tax=Arthrobacter zhangbolii TaxID=2886936 RepID=UPI001D13C633|nr:aminoglycoside phosphotransferase family protein [Arthrobacter zhangbolii]MCC3293301.1 aminoglycoside phosphotransferase family protein [Arthrobacter zhangbolii]
MHVPTVPVTDYRRTAARRPWAGLPAPVRQELTDLLGGSVTSVRPAGGGFTPGFAAVLSHGEARSIFVKAAPASDAFVYPAYAREAQVAPLLPPDMPAPRLLGTRTVTAADTDWLLLAHEAVDGTMPGHPWTGADLAAIEASCTTSIRLLSNLPGHLSGSPVSQDITAVPSPFQAVADGGAAPWFLPSLTAGDARRFQELWELSPEALAGDSVLHGDLRPDNILLRSGKALFCDWNFLGTGAPWIDWVGVLPYARGGGLDVDSWLTRSALTRGVPPEHIDAFLAALLAYMIHSGCQPEVESSPQLRSHGRHTAQLIHAWTVSRWAQK